MDTEERKFEWFLKWSGYNYGHTELRQAEKYLRSDFPLFRDSKARLVTAEEWQKMVDEGLIRDALRTEGMRPFWHVGEGELGLVALSEYRSYVGTWEKIDAAKTDFTEGWNAHEKYLKMLADWDEAIVEQQWRDLGEAQYARRDDKEKEIQMKVVLNRLVKNAMRRKLTTKSISDANRAGDEATEAWEREFAEYIANHNPSLPFDEDDYTALIGIIPSNGRME